MSASAPMEEGNSRAIMMFVNTPALELRARRWPAQFGRLLSLNRLLHGMAQIDADVHVFVRGDCIQTAGPRRSWHSQWGRNFGERLHNAVARIRDHYSQIIIVGQDCPELCVGDIERSFAFLEKGDIVLGPDHRGGTYLIGFRTSAAPPLERIAWRSNTDCQDLLAGHSLGKYCLLDQKIDLDQVADLFLLAQIRLGWSETVRGLLSQLISIPNLPCLLTLPSSRTFERILWQLPPPSSSPML